VEEDLRLDLRVLLERHEPLESWLLRLKKAGFVPHEKIDIDFELPEEVDTTALHDRAIAAGVGYVPGELFSASGMYRNCLRLNCGNPHTPEIEDAVRRLGRLIGG